MLKEMALAYYRNGLNCSQCVIKACSDKYDLRLPKECLHMCRGVYNGFGSGGICSVLVACIMIISIMCPNDIPYKRMLMEDAFARKMGGINCGGIRESSCENIIRNACDILEEIVKGSDDKFSEIDL